MPVCVKIFHSIDKETEMQKTLTVAGKRFTKSMIIREMAKEIKTLGDDYIIWLNGHRFYANYREKQDEFFAPVCSKNRHNCLALMEDDGTFTWSIWIA